MCEDFDLDFFSVYCCVGLWNTLFIILYSLFDVSRLMRWSTRSTEEIFALFISVAFFVDAFRDTIKSKSIMSFKRLSLKTGKLVELRVVHANCQGIQRPGTDQ